MTPVNGREWTPEEDEIVLNIISSDDCISALEARGFERTRDAVLARRKILRHGSAAAVQDKTGKRRKALEREIVTLEGRLDNLRRELVDLRVAQVKEGLGDIPLSEEMLSAIQNEVYSDGRDTT